MQAMPMGGQLNISLVRHDGETNSEAPGVELTVQDQGCGIPKDQLEKVFDPFYTTKENGVGLGLANVYQIVQQSGGSIQVESDENQGTRFTVKFPLPDPQPRTNREYSAAE